MRGAARQYGFEPVNKTGEELAALYVCSEKKCEGCGTPEEELGESLSIDHCHETGEFRGFLCRQCNSIIGFAKDDPSILENLIDYLSLVGV